MIKVLFKKQMMELFSFFWQDKKKNKIRTGKNLALSVLMYLFVFGTLAAMFYVLADAICEPFVAAGMDWLYFALMGILGVVLGAFGSIFNTFASLYMAKDNEMLFAMPIRPSQILLVRLLGVYFMGLMYQLLAMIPVLIKYYMVAAPRAAVVISTLVVTFLLSVFVLVLSAVLGWCVAWISTKTKHKSLVTVVLSLLFIGAYYYLYAMAAGTLQEIIAKPQIAGDFIKGSLSPLYRMGLAATGDGISLLLLTAVILLLFFAVYAALAKSYLKLATTNKGAAKAAYKEKQTKQHPVERALLGKEFRRFLGSPNYMLNCGLGILLMPLAAGAVVMKSATITKMAAMMFKGHEGILYLLAAAAICAVSSMNDMTAPSISLEGKNLWLVQAFPVSSRQVLMAKLKMQLLLTLIPAAVLTVCVEIVIKPQAVYAVLIPVTVAAFVFFMAVFGLFLNLKMPNQTWTNEIVPIKQSMPVMIALFGGWAVIMGLTAIYFGIWGFVSPLVYFICVTVLLIVASIVLFDWIRKKGTKIFDRL